MVWNWSRSYFLSHPPNFGGPNCRTKNNIFLEQLHPVKFQLVAALKYKLYWDSGKPCYTAADRVTCIFCVLSVGKHLVNKIHSNRIPNLGLSKNRSLTNNCNPDVFAIMNLY